MNVIRTICVFCGSAPGNDPIFAQAARKLGQAIVKADMQLVYGGGNNGLMGILAREVLELGGHVIGIIPEFLHARESRLTGAMESIIVPDMHVRKRMMFDRADAFVALPGGIGTLEELVEQLTWVQLGQHDKPVLLADVNGFWRPLLHLFAHMREHGFIRTQTEIRYLVSEKMEDVPSMLMRAAGHQDRADIHDALLQGAEVSASQHSKQTPTPAHVSARVALL